ncbi:MAG TPA: SpoIIE family protein phosphatase [Vicinamibacterales bacterium]
MFPPARTRLPRNAPDRHPTVQALVGTWPGRAILVGGAVRLLTAIVARLGLGTPALELAGSLGMLVLLVGLAYFLARAITLTRERLLWRVRRKLTLSYIFVGLVPALLIVVFGLLCALLLFGSVSHYILASRFTAAIEQAQLLARASAIEIARLVSDEDVRDYLERKQTTLASRYAGVSLAFVPVTRQCPSAEGSVGRMALRASRVATAGPWAHLAPPDRIPDWIGCDGFAGVVASCVGPPGAVCQGGPGVQTTGQVQLTVRAAVLAPGTTPRYAVVIDLPLNEEAAARIRRDTGIALHDITATGASPAPAPAGTRRLNLAGRGGGDRDGQFQPPWVVYLDYADWETGVPGRATVSITMSLGEIYNRLSPAREGERTFGQLVVLMLVIVGILFLLIQFAALVLGLALARSITGSVHELFVGTVRVQQGDFTHRIAVRARDQLGELAMSFNTMTSRLTGLLAEMAEKKRLEEELRIARDIQMSLLPQGEVRMPGLQLAAHCSPAREVGGDYYDFLPIDEHRIGLLIADVSGKGTSAALYMAEMKGLMLSLSQIHRSPRDLLIAANRIIAGNLDPRSFITMTYAVIDLERRVITSARAGHTPLIHLPARAPERRACTLAPDGMVLGLAFDRGERFAAVLEEATLPLDPGDLLVLFTDGISEAMNDADDLFGEARLRAIIEEHGHRPFDELRERILREVRAFTGDPGPHDDMTLILVKIDESAAAAEHGAAAAGFAAT